MFAVLDSTVLLRLLAVCTADAASDAASVILTDRPLVVCSTEDALSIAPFAVFVVSVIFEDSESLVADNSAFVLYFPSAWTVV